MITRQWAMPNANTFSIKPINEIISKYIKFIDVVIDPFARNSLIGTHRNDLNPDTEATYHLPANIFLERMIDEGILADVTLFDPPYSPRQVKECYDSIGIKVTQKDTQGHSPTKRLLANLLSVGGVGLCFGWNSVGMPKTWGFERIETLLVCHGGSHNDTIVTVDRKLPICSLTPGGKEHNEPFT